MFETVLKNNEQLRDAWELFQPHRDRVTSLLADLSKDPDDRLCVLGAGNCNDLDLAIVTERFREVLLVDWDTRAMELGVERQRDRRGAARLPSDSSIKLLGEFDLSGIGHELTSISPHMKSAASELQRLTAKLNSIDRTINGGSFSVVASTCLLSQLLHGVFQAFGEEQPGVVGLIQALRKHHLTQLIDNATPGGYVVLVTDIVSSLTCPQLHDVKEDHLGKLVGKLIVQSNFFTGLNPEILDQLLKRDPDVAPRLSEVHTLNPWLWDLGPRTYLVMAFIARLNNR